MTEIEARAIALLRETNEMYSKGHPQAANPGPVGRTASLLGTFEYLQVEGMVTLTGADRPYHLQVAQLVRSLLEAWFHTAWILAPDIEELRLRRVIGFKANGLRQYRAKLEYREEQGFGTVGPEEWEELIAQEGQVEELTETHGVDPLPTVKDGMEALGRPDLYEAYRWDSDVVHVSTTGLAFLVTDDVVGGLGSPSQVLTRLAMAWMVAGDLYELVAEALGFELHDWAEKRQAAQDELEGLYDKI